MQPYFGPASESPQEGTRGGWVAEKGRNQMRQHLSSWEQFR
jgi:hypothetical protein